MTIFYLICCLLWFTLILCNIHFADKQHKLKGWQFLWAVVIGLLPFINTLFLVFAVVVAYREATA